MHVQEQLWNKQAITKRIKTVRDGIKGLSEKLHTQKKKTLEWDASCFSFQLVLLLALRGCLSGEMGTLTSKNWVGSDWWLFGLNWSDKWKNKEMCSPVWTDGNLTSYWVRLVVCIYKMLWDLFLSSRRGVRAQARLFSGGIEGNLRRSFNLNCVVSLE